MHFLTRSIFRLLLAAGLLLGGVTTLTGQARPWSVELEPAFGFARSDVDGFAEYSTVRPLIQVNYRINPLLEPHLRVGRVWAWGPDIDSRRGTELGAGLRLHFAHLLPIRDLWTVERIRFYLFGNYALSDYSLDAERIPYQFAFGSGQIGRAGLGMAIRFTERIGVRVDMGYAYRSRALRGQHGRTAAMGFIWHW